MSSLPSLGTSTTNIMSVLTQTALNNAAQQENYRFQLVQQQLTKQYQQKIAALQSASQTSPEDNFLTVQISAESQQKATFSTLQTQYGTNVNVLSDITQQITTMQNAASSGDSATFDGALATANADVTDLTVVQPNPAFQDDGVTQLKQSGLGVQSSSNYDLSTAAGQQAALADLQNAANTINQVYTQSTTNQTIAGSEVTSLENQISTQQSTVENDQLNQSVAEETQTAQLQQQLQTEEHLIELNFSNAQSAATSLQQQQQALQATLQPAPPGTILSIFG